MKISLNWLKEFVELPPLEPKALVEAITLSTCEVEGMEQTGAHLSQVLVAEVISVVPHPDSDKLSLVVVDQGQGRQQVVCGAKNMKPGDKVAFAGLGVTLPNGMTLQKAKIRGIESEGMLCAADELGLADDHEGLLILPAAARPGQVLSQLFPDAQDLILEIDNKSITHRPDLWGHYGFARELAAIYQCSLKPYPAAPPPLAAAACPVEVSVKSALPTLRYTALALDHAQIVASPSWMQQRLRRVGLRPINNAVDVTNYVMLELGQPLHAFDRTLIQGGRLTIEQAQPGQTLETLAGKPASLTAEDLVLSDAQGPSVVAGVVGGLHSGVQTATTQLLMEAACWDAVAVRHTAVRIGIRTDSSQRFEKSQDPANCLPALWRSLELLRLTCPQIAPVGGLFDFYPTPAPVKVIPLDAAWVSRRLGVELAAFATAEILTRLGFGVKAQGSLLQVTVPSFRATKDIDRKEDLLEEVGRIHGLTRIPPQPPLFPIVEPLFNGTVLLERNIQSCLSSLGFLEVLSYPMTNARKEALFHLDEANNLHLVNPVTDHHEMMRTSLVPPFVDRVAQWQKEVLGFRLFEIGRSYKLAQGQPQETNWLLMGLSLANGDKGQAFYELKADLLSLMNQLRLGAFALAAQAPKPYQHQQILAGLHKEGANFGEIFSLHPGLAKELGIKGQVALAQVNLDLLFGFNKPDYVYQEPWRYPAVPLELSIVIPSRTGFARIQDLLLAASPLVRQVDYLNQFDLGEGRISLSVKALFRDAHKTLEPDEIKGLQDQLIAAVTAAGYHLR